MAASLSAPQLFLIAEDLSRMQILVSVDESDIGEIHEGQEVRFTVQAYPDDGVSVAVLINVNLSSESDLVMLARTLLRTLGSP